MAQCVFCVPHPAARLHDPRIESSISHSTLPCDPPRSTTFLHTCVRTDVHSCRSAWALIRQPDLLRGLKRQNVQWPSTPSTLLHSSLRSLCRTSRNARLHLKQFIRCTWMVTPFGSRIPLSLHPPIMKSTLSADNAVRLCTNAWHRHPQPSATALTLFHYAVDPGSVRHATQGAQRPTSGTVSQSSRLP